MLQIGVKQLDGIAGALAAMEAATATKVQLLAEYVGTEAIATVKGLTEEIRPPGYNRLTRRWTGMRRAHPGHWADITNVLVNSYGHRTWIAGPANVMLELFNTAPYAKALEDKDNYWVLEGVTRPRGPVEQALRQGLRRIAPDWTMQGYGD